ncbi:cytosine-5--methyltransferase [Mycena floridula]|nr:cytosine-5--methyltransferase [Mycena floridula]
MGRGKKGGSRGGRRNRPKGDSRSDDYRTDLLEKTDMQNERFNMYYKAQNIVPVDQWDQMIDSLRTPLPTTFRVAGSRQTAHSLNTTIKETYVTGLGDVVFEGQAIPPPVQIPWYPEGLAWQFNVPKKVLRKSPEFKKFHSFLVFETEVGNVSRQEAVSMLPPLFLDVEPHHKVMDMCAAPGSKTAQLLEALHAQDTTTASSIPSGLLIANDSDYKRTHLLIHQSARLPSPALMVTNVDASSYPIIRIPNPKIPSRLEQLLFDRILCDVPCSGDGTLRKNIGIWKSWQPGDGNGLYSLQLRILQRAMKLLKEDGRIVYSTCSLNPVENEAVVAAALKSNPEFHLVDVSSKLPELHRRPGLTVWRPTDRRCETTYGTYEEYLAANPIGTHPSKLSKEHWPPVEKLNLEYCMRIYPHLQDTGGFFVAVLERKPRVAKERKRSTQDRSEESLPETKKPRLDEPVDVKEAEDMLTLASGVEEGNKIVEDATSITGDTPAAAEPALEPDRTFGENPYTFLSPDEPNLVGCLARLKLLPTFPSSNVLVRNPEMQASAARSLYIANDLVKAVILNNDYTRLRLNSAGTKVFVKQDAGRGFDTQFRVLGEGLPVVLPFVDPVNIIDTDIDTLKALVSTYYPLCDKFEEPFRGAIMERDNGSHIIRLVSTELKRSHLNHDLVLPLWKSNVSVALMIDKKAKTALSLRLFGVDLSPVGNQEREKKKDEGPKDEAIIEPEDKAIVEPEDEAIIEPEPEAMQDEDVKMSL